MSRLGYKSPLFYACEVNARSCIGTLLDAGADPHWKDPFSNRTVTPTLLAFRKDPRADPNSLNSQKLTPLHLAASEGHKQSVECLLKHGAKPNIIGGPNSRTPIHVAVQENRRDCVEVLLSYGADLTIKDSGHLAPLMTAISVRNDKVAMLLIQKGTVDQLDVCDSGNQTALMYAIYFGQFKAADALVERGVCCSAVDSRGNTAESLLKQKVQSLWKTAGSSTSTINKILRNIVGGSNQASSTLAPAGGRGRVSDVESVPGGSSSSAAVDKKPQMSEESVRKLNAKRKKVANRLLKK